MTIGEIIDAATERLGRTDSATRDAALKFVNLRFKMFWRARLWRDTLYLGKVSVWKMPTEDSAIVASADVTYEKVNDVIMPPCIDRVLGLWSYDENLEIQPEELCAVLRTNTSAIESTSLPTYKFTEIGRTAHPMPFPNWPNYPMGAKLITTAVTSGTYQLKITTNLRTVTVNTGDTLTLTSGSVKYVNVLSSPTYLGIYKDAYPPETIISIEKPEMPGEGSYSYTMQIWAGDGTGTNFSYVSSRLPERACAVSNLMIRLHGGPPSTEYLGVIGKKKPPEGLDEDQPIPIRGLEEALVAAVQGDLLERQREYAKAQLKHQEATALMRSAWAEEMNQSANNARLIPDIAEQSIRDLLLL